MSATMVHALRHTQMRGHIESVPFLMHQDQALHIVLLSQEPNFSPRRVIAETFSNRSHFPVKLIALHADAVRREFGCMRDQDHDFVTGSCGAEVGRCRLFASLCWYDINLIMIGGISVFWQDTMWC